jgi:hypothetical protein
MRLLPLLLLTLTAYAQCPNNFCEDATELTLCEPMPFDNSTCIHYGVDPVGYAVLQSAFANPQGWGGVANYTGNPPYHTFFPHWYSFSVEEEGHYDMNYTATLPSGGGIGWAMLYGSCDYVNVTMNTTTNSPYGWFTANTAHSSLWTDPNTGMITYWVEQPIGFPYMPYSGVVGQQNSWHMTFYLFAGEYKILLKSHQNTTTAQGQITICGVTPLNLPPHLSVEGTKLTWSGTPPFTLERYGMEWEEVKNTEEHTHTAKVGGAYRVVNSYGVSNAVWVNPIVEVGSGPTFNIIGQQLTK